MEHILDDADVESEKRAIIKIKNMDDLKVGATISNGQEIIVYNQRGEIKTIQTSESKTYGTEYWMNGYNLRGVKLISTIDTLIDKDTYERNLSIVKRS